MKRILSTFITLAALFATAITATAVQAEEFQKPTLIGATATDQQALMLKLTQGQIDDSQKRQLLLLKLAMFANDKNGKLETLEGITNELQAYQKANKKDYEIMAALGNAMSLQSVFYQDNLGKMNFLARKGMRYMDRAVKKAPNNLGARILRGISYANMPAFLNRAAFAEKDLSLLKEQMAKQPGSEGFIEFIDYYLAMALAKNNKKEQANTLWAKLKANTNSLWAEKAGEQLKGNH